MLSEDLSYQVDECRKVFYSFEYFLDTYVYIEDKEHNRALKLEMWPEQRRVVPIVLSNKVIAILKTQQIGFTWLFASALSVWESIRNPLFLTVNISVNEDLSQELLERAYFIIDRLPPWLCPPIKTKTKQTIEFQHENNLVSTIKSLPSTEMGAQSKTPNLLILDETCKNRLIKKIYNASSPGVEAAKGRIVVISNALKTGPGWSWTRDLYTASMRGDNNVTRIFLNWKADPRRPEDFRERMRLKGMDEQEVKERYPETEAEALEAASGGYFADTLKRHDQARAGVTGFIRKDRQGEIEFQVDPRGILEVWRFPYFMVSKWDGVYYEKRYAIGVDVSEGLGESSSVAYVIDRQHDEIVCRVRSNRLDAVEWAEQIHLLSQFYCDYRPDTRKTAIKTKSLICTEVTGAGQTTVKELIKAKANQYVRMVPDTVGSGLTKQYGWAESNQSKHELCGDLKAWFRTTRGTVYCGTLLSECSTFVRFDNGKLDHEEGKRSDCVIAAGLTIQASIFLGGKPTKIEPPLTGWKARKQEDIKKQGIWAA